MAVDYAVLKKGGFMRQKQKDNFSLRLRVVGGNVTAEQLAKVAEVAEKYGDGHVHLTSRQSIEIPFIKLDQISEVKAALAEGGVEPGVCGRCVKSCPTEAWDTVHGYIVSFGGLFGNRISKGEPVIPFIEDHDKLMAVCDAAIGFFKDNALPSERFRATIERVGEDRFREHILAACDNG